MSEAKKNFLVKLQGTSSFVVSAEQISFGEYAATLLVRNDNENEIVAMYPLGTLLGIVEQSHLVEPKAATTSAKPG